MVMIVNHDDVDDSDRLNIYSMMMIMTKWMTMIE